jgi:hypothetical protein
LRSAPPEWLLAIAVALAVVVLVQSLRLAYRPWQLRRRLAENRERGAMGEESAERLLRRRGFAVLARQVAVTYDLEVDGEPVPVGLRADYLVANARGRFVAEVKTGDLAPRIETAATRRQLLEYRLAFERLDVQGVLLVDPEASRISVIEFPFSRVPRATGAGLGWLLVGLLAGTLALVAARFV